MGLLMAKQEHSSCEPQLPLRQVALAAAASASAAVPVAASAVAMAVAGGGSHDGSCGGKVGDGEEREVGYGGRSISVFFFFYPEGQISLDLEQIAEIRSISQPYL